MKSQIGNRTEIATMKKLTNIDKKLHWTTFWSEKLPAVIGALTMLVLVLMYTTC